jgi:very-short-patch-repair endonuclease
VTTDDAALALAASQMGLITRRQAHKTGMSDRQIRTRVTRGLWQPLHPSVFLLGIAPISDEQRLLAAALATSAVVSHTSAGWLAGLVDRPPSTVHVLTDRAAAHRREGIVVHRVADLLPIDRTRLRGVPSTSPTRTLLDLSAELDETVLRATVHRALRLRLTHPDRLIERFVAMRSRGKPGVASLRKVLGELDRDVSLLESDLEVLLVDLIRTAGLPQPTLQHPIFVHGRVFRADLAYPEHRLVIEGDGFGVHGERDAFESDRERQNLLVLDGWRILRFTWRQIVREPAWVATQIHAALSPPDRSRGLR